MYGVLITIHIVICLGLIMVILMQSAKGEGLAGAFGGTALTGAVFGGRGAATFLSKATSTLAIAFMLSCLVLTFISPARVAAQRESAVKQQLEDTQPIQTQPSALPGETGTEGGDFLPPANEGGTQPTPGDGGDQPVQPEGGN